MRARHILVFGTFLVSLLLYIDRACISVAKEPVVDTFFAGMDEEKQDYLFGWILSIFTLGYALAQTPSGIMADRYGPRRVLASVIAIWSLLTALTGAAFNYVSMLVTRFLFGMGEAGAFPALARSTFSWYPVKERGLVTGINFSASRIGGAAAIPLMAWLITEVGWRNSFFILGGIGVLFAIVWFALFRDDPVEHKWVSEEEKRFIAEHRQQPTKSAARKLPFTQIVRSPNMRKTMVQYFCSNFTFFFTLGWMFPYMKKTYELSTTHAAWLAAIPLLGGAAGNWFSGWLVDRIYRKGQHVRSRRVPALVGFSLAALGLLITVQMSNEVAAVAFLTLAIFGADMTLSPSWSFCVDIGDEHAGAVSGTMNMAGNFGSFCTALAFPYLEGWFGSNKPFFYIAAGLNVVAIIMWLQMRPDRPLKSEIPNT